MSEKVNRPQENDCMLVSQFRLRSLMIVIFASALVLAAGVQISKMEPPGLFDFDERVFLVIPFLVLVALKMGLVVAARSRRAAREDARRPGPGEDSRADAPSS
jgi:hypothetical protein